MQNAPGRGRQILTRLGWVLLYALIGVAALLTGWSLLALLGVVPTTPPGGQLLSPGEVASVGAASATLLLATVTVLLALYTRRSLELGQAELRLAEATLRTAEGQAQRSAEQVTATLEQVKVTQDQVKVTQEQADIARRSLEAGWRPFLVDVPYGYAPPPGLATGATDAAVVEADKLRSGGARVRVSLRNIGSGLAIITKAGLSFGQLHATATSLSSSIVAVGEVVRITFEIQPEGAVLINMVSQIEARRPFIVTAIYTDQGGINTWRSRAYFKVPTDQQGGRHEVEKVELYAGEDIIPFATAGAT
jgi:hypothetical protein